jgi:hypothetical protein
MFKVSTWSFHAGIAEDRLLGPYGLPRCFDWGCSPRFPKDTSFQSCWKMWICRLGLICSSCTMVLRHILFLQFGNYSNRVSGTMDRTRRTTEWSARSPAMSTLYFYLWGHVKYTVYVAEVSDIKDLQQLIQNGFYMIRTTPAIFQRVRESLFRRAASCVKPEVDTLRVLFKIQKAVTRKPCFRKPLFTKYDFLVLCSKFASCSFVVYVVHTVHLSLKKSSTVNVTRLISW